MNPYAARGEGLLLKSTDNPGRFPVRHAMWPAGPVLLNGEGFLLWDEELDQPVSMPQAS
jgi:hypothetical protein